MSFLIVRIRSLDVSGIAEDDGSFVTVHFRNVCLGEARTSLRFRSIASAPDLPWEEVRLRLDSFDARLFLSRSVVHFAPDTSSEGERKVTARTNVSE